MAYRPIFTRLEKIKLTSLENLKLLNTVKTLIVHKIDKKFYKNFQ
jgi:hypothetical protein